MANHEPEFSENSSLIASDKVEGTVVYNNEGEKLGKIQNFMVNKHNGQVEYAVMSFGGIFGMGEQHFPLPWSKLKYVVEREGYVVDIDQNMLEKAPKYEGKVFPVYDPAYGMMVNSYYGVGQ